MYFWSCSATRTAPPRRFELPFSVPRTRLGGARAVPLAVGPRRLSVEQRHELAEVLVGLGIVDHRGVGVLVLEDHRDDGLVPLVGDEEMESPEALRRGTLRIQHVVPHVLHLARLHLHATNRPVHLGLLHPSERREHTPRRAARDRLARWSRRTRCRETAASGWRFGSGRARGRRSCSCTAWPPRRTSGIWLPPPRPPGSASSRTTNEATACRASHRAGSGSTG